MSIKIKTKMLSLQYDSKEDRMKLTINKDKEDAIVFWMTRHFYLSTLFDVDTYLESMGIDKKDFLKKNDSSDIRSQRSKDKKRSSKKTNQSEHLLKRMKLTTGQHKKRFFISFYADSLEVETVMSVDKFLGFYAMMKSSFPKKLWGII